MARKQGRHPHYEELEIIDVAAEGKAIAKHNDMVIFVTGAIPGDIVDVQVNKRKKNFREGYPTKFHKYSNDRVEPICSHFGVCGGCKWQMLPYDKQLFYKHKQVVDNLERIGKLDLPEVQPILAAQDATYYRNKLEYTYSALRWLEKSDVGKEHIDTNAVGFHVPGKFDRIVDVEHCHLQGGLSNEIRLFTKQYATDKGHSFYNHRDHSGFLRNLIVRTASTGELMVILVITKKDPALKEMLDAVAEQFPQITSLMYVVNAKMNDSISDLNVQLHSGRDHIFEAMEGLQFKIGPKSFYQTNSSQAYELYKVARNFAGLSGDEVVYDLYTGTGTIANFVAKQAKQVIGIEYIPEAIEDAKVNSAINKIENTLFFAGDMKDVLNTDFVNKHGCPDVIITDPPRAGMHPGVVETILKANPEKVVYVSCNPATQARDLALMSHQYTVTKVQAVDMFPHTHHVENVVLLERK